MSSKVVSQRLFGLFALCCSATVGAFNPDVALAQSTQNPTPMSSDIGGGRAKQNECYKKYQEYEKMNAPLSNAQKLSPTSVEQKSLLLEIKRCYEEASELDADNVIVIFNLGEIFEKLEMHASAFVMFTRVGREAKKRETADKGRARADNLDNKWSELKINISEQDRKNTKLLVVLNGREVKKSLWGTAIPIDKGEHTVEVSAPGMNPRKHEVKIKKGLREPNETPEEVNVPALEAIVPPPLPCEIDPDPQAHCTPLRRKVALGVGGAGLAFLAVGGVFAGLASSQWDDAIDACNPLVRSQETACKDESHRMAATPDGESAHTKAIIATAAFVTGAAALGTGIALYFTYSPPASSPNVSELKINPFVFGASDWGVGVSGKF